MIGSTRNHPQPAMSTITFAFHPFRDPHNLSNTHSLLPDPPSITALTSLHEPAFSANYGSLGVPPTTFSPTQYGPPAGFHHDHGNETHGLPLGMHPPDASSLLFGSYAPPPEISQRSLSTILRHDTYEDVLGNAFNPAAPTRLAPQAQTTVFLPTLGFPCLAPPPSLPVQTDPPASNSTLSDPLQSTLPPERPACSKEHRVSQDDAGPYITSQPQADHGLQSYTTTAAPKSPVPPLQPGYHQRSFPTSSGGQQQQPQPGYPTVPVDRWSSSADEGQCPSVLSVAHQQQQMAEYPPQQYQSQNQAHWYGSGAQPTNALMSQPSQPTHGYSSTAAGPSYSHHAHHPHAPTRTAPMYAAPMYTGSIPTAPSQWTGSAYQLPPYTSPTHAIGTYLDYTPAGSVSNGSGSIARPIPPMVSGPTPPMVSGPIPPSAMIPRVTRPLSLSGGSNGTAAGPSAVVSAVSTQVCHGDSSNQGQKYSLVPAGYPQLVQAQPYRQQPYTLSTCATPAEVAPLANDVTSHISPQSPRANLIVSGVAPNSGAGPSSSNVNASTKGEPTSSNHQIGPSRRARANRRQTSKTFKRPTSASRKTRPITYEGNLVRLQQRCRGQGADEGTIGLLGKIFANGVSLEALKRLLTDAEAETNEFGIKTGMIYTALLEHPDEENDGYTCRLCHSEQTWKHHKDVLRHLNRDHFGVSDGCDQCNKKFYTKGEKTKHHCK